MRPLPGTNKEVIRMGGKPSKSTPKDKRLKENKPKYGMIKKGGK
jgi:hypothetical protein